MQNLLNLDGLKGLSRPVLVTGHTGFKGTWLTLLLKSLGIDVVGYSLEAEPHSLYNRLNLLGDIPEHFGNIESYDELETFIGRHQPSVVLHLAAQPLVSKSYAEPIATFKTNAIGTANVLEISRKYQTEVVGVVTTDKVYKNENLGNRFRETDPLFGHDPYSASKVATETVASAWGTISKNFGGPKITTLRAGNVIGGGDFAENRLLPDLVRSIFYKEKLAIRGKSSTRPWQHVLDPLFGYLLAVESAIHSENFLNSYNFGPTEASKSVGEVLAIVRDLGFSLNFDEVEMLEDYEAVKLDLDSTKSQNELHWSPKWTQSEAIESTMSWWKQVMNLGTTPEVACQNEIDYLLDRN